jgi:primosomal protein N' (replication factor Y)
MLGKDDKIKILGPCPCVISKIKELFRWQIIIKGRISLDMAQAIKKTVYDLTSSVHDDIKVSMDINPTSTL